MDTTKENNNDLTSGPLTIKIIKFIIPLMLTGILQLLYNAADSIVVGHYDGSSALAAVSSVGALINLLVNAFMGLSVGAAVVVAQDYGAKDYDTAKENIRAFEKDGASKNLPEKPLRTGISGDDAPSPADRYQSIVDELFPDGVN